MRKSPPFDSQYDAARDLAEAMAGEADYCAACITGFDGDGSRSSDEIFLEQNARFQAFLNDSATLDVHVTGGASQLLIVTKDGLPAGIVPITSDDFRTTIAAARDASSGPLGTFWRVDCWTFRKFT